MARAHETKSACLIFDDSIEGEPYTDENELVCWHFDHTKGQTIKGINILTAFYHSHSPDQELPLRIPVGLEAVRKPTRWCDLTTRKEKRGAEATKNELMRQLIGQCIRNRLEFTYVLGDSWYGLADNMRFIQEKKKISSSS